MARCACGKNFLVFFKLGGIFLPHLSAGSAFFQSVFQLFVGPIEFHSDA